MTGLIIISAMLGNMLIPLIAGRERSERRGIQTMVFMMVALNAVYAVVARYAFLFS